MSDRDVVIRVEGVSKLYRLGEVGTGSLAHDVNRWWHKVRGKEDPYLKIGEVNDRTRPAKAAGAKELEDRPSEVADALHGPKRSKLGTAEGGGEGTAGGNQQADAGDSQSEWSGSFEGPSSSSLGSGSAKTPPDRAPVVLASASSSVLIRDIRGKKIFLCPRLPHHLRKSAKSADNHLPLPSSLRRRLRLRTTKP